MPVCGNYLFFELPKKIVLNPKDGEALLHCTRNGICDLYGLSHDPGDHQRGSTCKQRKANRLSSTLRWEL